MDIDRDGKISESDLLNSFTMMNLEFKKSKIKDIMLVADLNRDGYLDFEEFKTAL